MEGSAEEAARIVRRLADILPKDHRVVVLIFDGNDHALLLSHEPYPETLCRLREWVDAQEGGPVETFDTPSN